MDESIRRFYEALFDLIGLINEPERDQALYREAGIVVERALLRLLVAIDRCQVVGIMNLAGLVDRDHSTVSRQVAVLERQGLVVRAPGQRDRRERKVMLTAQGKEIVQRVEAARERLLQPILARWDEQDWQLLVTLFRRLVDDLLALPTEAPPSSQSKRRHHRSASERE
ncbi:MarR family winged helix-turn-helix transcriptional regulator [Thermogemmatispora carboxidivorans]|uniref:MarR family winged helix-turn-helix transcriptional regulator n=1 Tax=Thermogemmatispora carboxidivorans TaxID=1382306 RepID=UPI000699D535|nr:MarR family transcriptional regulator [Thermogemmatispora carboxidivorans]